MLGKNTHHGRATAHAHALLQHAVDNGRKTRLDHQLRAAIDGQLHRLLVAQSLHHVHGDTAFFLAASGQVVYPTERQHLRAIFGGGDMPHHLALHAHIGLLCTQESVGVDLHLEAAVTENAFGDHGHHVHTVDLRRHDERRWFVVGVGGGRADACDKHLIGVQQVTMPRRRPFIRRTRRKRHEHRLVFVERAAQKNHRVHTHQQTFAVGITVTSTQPALRNLAKDGAGIALDLGTAHALIARLGTLWHLLHRSGLHAGKPIGF